MADQRSTGKAKVDLQNKKKGKKTPAAEQYMQRSLHICDNVENWSASATDRRRLVDERDSSSSSDDDVFTHADMRGEPSTAAADGGDDSATPSTTRRRGDARAHSPSRCSAGRREIFFVGDALLGNNGLSGFFRPQMRNELDGFYPQWVNVPIENKNRIWDMFLKEWSLGEHDHDFVYNKFMAQNVDKYCKFLHDLKLLEMKKHKVDDVKDLLDQPKPPFMKSDKIWKKYVLHWASPEQRARSIINKQNRASRQGISHEFGRRSAADCLHDMAVEGKKSSLLFVLANVNKKRDERRNPTDEVHHHELQDSSDEYRQRHEEANP